MSEAPSPPLDLTEHLTVCISPNARPIGAKVWVRGAAKPSPQVQSDTLLQMSQVPVGSFEHLADVLDELLEQPDRYIVRGDLIAPGETLQRRLLADRADSKATLRDAPKRQLFLDLDCPPDAFPEPDGALDAKYAASVWQRIGMLETAFEDAECWWSFTGSAGIKPGVRMRVMVWLRDPLTSVQARRWAEALNDRVGFALLDPAVYSANQPNLIAAPILNGQRDPCHQRSGRIEGASCAALTVPAGEVRKAKASAAAAIPEDFIPEGKAAALPRAAEVYLSRLQPGAFNNPIKAAVGAAVGADIDDSAIVARIMDCIAERGGAERVAEWRTELPRLLSWTRAQEAQKRAEALANAKPHPGVDTLLSVPVARERLSEALQQWGREAVESLELRALLPADQVPQFPRLFANVGVGLGKTESAIEMIGELLEARGRIERVVYMVPTHKLSAELVDRFAARGIEARVWYGVTAKDEEGKPKVCTEPEIRDAALQIQGALTEACKRCPAAHGCAYRAQHQARPRVWLTSHEMLFMSPPETLREVQALVVDESFWQKGLRGVNEHPARLLLSTLDADPNPLEGRDRADLGEMRAWLLDAMRNTGDGARLTAEALRGAGLSAALVDHAIELEWRRKPDVGDALKGVEGSSGAIINALVKLREERFAPLLPRLWSQARALLEGEFAQVTVHDEIAAGAAGSGPGVELAWREDIHETWRSMPVLLLDATGQREIVERYWGPVTTLEVQAELPRVVQVTQVHDTAAALSMFARGPYQADDGKDQWRANNVARIAELLEVKASEPRRRGGKTDEPRRIAVICQKELEARLLAEGLPDNVTTAHFGAIEGRDHLRDVDLLVVIGRTLPAPATVERMAEVLFSRQVEPIGGQYPEETVRLHGSRQTVEARRHPDAHAEAVRAAIAEGAVVQAIGRARAVNRDAKTPLDVLIIGNLPVPTIRPDRVVSWTSVTPTPWQLAAARAGFLPLSPPAMVATKVWKSEDGARKALERVREGVKKRHSPIGDPYRGLSHFETPYRYRPTVAQTRWSSCYGPEDSAEARRRLEALIGAVAVWELVRPPAEAPAPARTGRPALPAALPPRAVPPLPLPAPSVQPFEGSYMTKVVKPGASPLRVAHVLGVSPQKLRELVANMKKRPAPPGLVVPAHMVEYLALAELRGHDTVMNCIHGLIEDDLSRSASPEFMRGRTNG